MAVEIIAEVAQGYEGDPGQAKLLVRAAVRAGADAVKFQVINADELATKHYQYYPLFRTLEMPEAAWRDVRACATDGHVRFYVDVFGERSLALAEALHADAISIHSTDMRHESLLAAVKDSAVPRVLLSVSGSTLVEVDHAIAAVGEKMITLIHGFQAYPTHHADNQIARISALRRHYEDRRLTGITFGFADHVPKDDPFRSSLAAIAIGQGATVIEKHLTLSPIMEFEDHESAISPDEFRQFAEAMRVFATALGTVDPSDPFLGMSESERRYRRTTRKHVVAARPIKQGDRIDVEMLVLKRTPQEGSLTDMGQVIGRTAAQDLDADQPITAACLASGDQCVSRGVGT